MLLCLGGIWEAFFHFFTHHRQCTSVASWFVADNLSNLWSFYYSGVLIVVFFCDMIVMLLFPLYFLWMGFHLCLLFVYIYRVFLLFLNPIQSSSTSLRLMQKFGDSSTVWKSSARLVQWDLLNWIDFHWFLQAHHILGVHLLPYFRSFLARGWVTGRGLRWKSLLRICEFQLSRGVAGGHQHPFPPQAFFFFRHHYLLCSLLLPLLPVVAGIRIVQR